MIQTSKSKYAVWGMTVALSLALSGCGGSEQSASSAQAQKPARKATVAQMAPQNIALDKQYPAMVRSDSAVSIVARVGGRLEAQHYKAGEQVKPGQLLFSLEKGPYVAAVAQRRADLRSAQATLENTRRDNQRYQSLFQRGAISQQQRDKSTASLETAQAGVQQAKAALDNAQINLGYTEVRAPVGGQAGLNNVNVGSIVDVGTALATVTPTNPLEVRFQLPQQDAFMLRQQEQQVGVPKVVAQLEFQGINGPIMLEGKLNFLGAEIDRQTSTVEARASFENKDNLFLPGQFVRVRLKNVMRFNVMAVPEISVTQGLMGTQVFTLDANNEIKPRPVVLGEVAGQWQIINEGLTRDDRVIFGDPAGISPGDRIDPQPFSGTLESAPKAGDEAAAQHADAHGAQ